MFVPDTVLPGVLWGLIGSAPALILCEASLRSKIKAQVSWGLAALAISFVTLTLAIALKYLQAPNETLTFGVSVTATFLAVWATEATRALCDARRRSRSEGRIG